LSFRRKPEPIRRLQEAATRTSKPNL